MSVSPGPNWQRSSLVTKKRPICTTNREEAAPGQPLESKLPQLLLLKYIATGRKASVQYCAICFNEFPKRRYGTVTCYTFKEMILELTLRAYFHLSLHRTGIVFIFFPFAINSRISFLSLVVFRV